MTINATDCNPAAKPQLRKTLKLWQVVMMGLAYLTPMTVFDTFGIVSGVTDGHVPSAYLLRWPGCCLPPLATVSWFASFRPLALLTPTRRKQSTRTSVFWSAGPRCWITCSCR